MVNIVVTGWTFFFVSNWNYFDQNKKHMRDKARAKMRGARWNQIKAKKDHQKSEIGIEEEITETQNIRERERERERGGWLIKPHVMLTGQ